MLTQQLTPHLAGGLLLLWGDAVTVFLQLLDGGAHGHNRAVVDVASSILQHEVWGVVLVTCTASASQEHSNNMVRTSVIAPVAIKLRP